MATMDDIARKLGIAKSTVSKALNGAGDVSEAMRRTVLEAAVELGYTRLRRSEEAPKLAVFISHMGYQHPQEFGYDIIVGFRKLAEPEGYQVDVIPLTLEIQKSIRYDAYMMQMNYRGGFFLGLNRKDPWMQEFKACKTPTVLYDNYIPGNPLVTYVGTDTKEGMGLAVEYLIRLGHRKIGFLGEGPDAYIFRQRYLGYLDALRENGLDEDLSLAGCDDKLHICLDVHLPRLLESGCTAILCGHDTLALQVMGRCRQLGIQVPRQVSIIGFDDLPLCAQTQPPLTSIRQNRTELGKSAYCSLSSQIRHVPLSTFLLHTELVERASCAPPSQKKSTIQAKEETL